MPDVRAPSRHQFFAANLPGLLRSSIQSYDGDRAETASSYSISGLVLNDGSSGPGGHRFLLTGGECFNGKEMWKGPVRRASCWEKHSPKRTSRRELEGGICCCAADKRT